MSNINKDNILKVLRKIQDPDLHQDIVELGFVQNLKVNGCDVSFDIALTTPACPVKAEFQRQAEELVMAIHGVASVHVNMTTLAAQKHTIPASSSAGTNNSLVNIGSIIAVSSCKGGVGKSTIAVHMATELAHRGFRVGLIDADLHGPSVPTLLNLHNVSVYTDEKNQLIPIVKNNLHLMSFGFLLGDAPAVMRGPMVSRYIQQILFNTAWGKLDYLFIDMPPGTGDVQLTITQSLRLSGAVIITTRQSLSLVDVSRGILMFEKVDVPILGIIENMSHFICDQCNKKHDIFGGQTETSLNERFGLETLAQIPLLPALTASIDLPVANEYIQTAVEQVIRSLGRHVIQKKEIPQITFDQENTTLHWPKENETLKISNRSLRLSCRCALCVNEANGQTILKEADVRSGIAPLKISPLGNYAIGIEWNDGHTSGIYPYRNIRAFVEARM